MTLLIPTNRRPISPGEVLREDFLEPLKLTQQYVADALGVDRSSLSELLNGHRRVSPEMAARLGHAFSTSPQYWLNLQMAVDLYETEHSAIKSEIEKKPVLV